jgi:fluoride exporter
MNAISFNQFLIVGAGGAFGAMARQAVNILAVRFIGTGFPWGTLIVNVIGSFIMGVIAGWLAKRGAASDHAMRLFLLTGILGGFTTFSAFSLEAVNLWQRGTSVEASAYVAASVVLAIMALIAGLALSRGFA